MESKIIGNGSFGYIFKPCLKFNDTLNINKEKYITKLLYNDDAEDEFNNIKLLNNIDISGNYHLGTCYKTKLDDKIYKDIINDYKLSLFKDLKTDELSCIIMKNGGNNLNYYAKIFKILSVDKIDMIYSFIKEYYKLLEGIKLFNNNNIILHDIKPANILYDENKLVFIDFSLTNTKDTIINLAYESKYDLSIYYSSFPFETNYYNFNKYNNLKKKVNYDINIFCSNLELALTTKINIKNLNKNLVDLFNELSTYYYNSRNYKKKNEIIKNMLIKFKDLLINLKKMNYAKFIEKSLNTLDTYSYGVTLIFILNHIEHIIPNELFIILMDFAMKLSFIDLDNRLTIDNALLKFKFIINEYIDKSF